ncbi:MAG: sulfatase [bacterium]
MLAKAMRLTVAALLIAGCAAAQLGGDDARAKVDAHSATRPNILLFTADDHGKLDSGCYGNDAVRTPTLDSLAASGLVFDNMHTTTAICCPSRTALMTGLYPHTSGVFGLKPADDAVVPLTSRLVDAGYVCALVGKRHLAPWEAYRFEYAPTDPKQEEGGRSIAAYEADVRGFFQRRRVESDTRPFFLMVNFHDPHRPFREQFVDADAKPFAAVRIPPTIPDIAEARDEFTLYYHYIERLDRGVALCLAALRDAGLADNTLVIYTSDHGAAFPFAKTTLYEAGLCVPFIASWPGHTVAHSRTAALASFVDFAPTILDVAGAPLPAELQGESFAAQLRTDAAHAARDASASGEPGANDTRREACVYGSQTDDIFRPSFPMRSVRCGTWKYIYNFSDKPDAASANVTTGLTWQGMLAAAVTDTTLATRVALYERRPREELFDLARDPFELTNLAADPHYESTLADLRHKLVAHMDAINDPLLAILPFATTTQQSRLRPAYDAYQAYDAERARLPHSPGLGGARRGTNDDLD